MFFEKVLTRLLPLTSYLINYCASVSATDKYTRHSVHVTQLYIGTTEDIQLAPRQKSYQGDATQGQFGMAANYSANLFSD